MAESISTRYFYHQTYIDKSAQFQKLRDSFDGNEKIKAGGAVYLPVPSGMTDASGNPTAAYTAYKTRSLFYSVPERTIRGLLGIIFRVGAMFKLPDRLKVYEDAVTPEGDSLNESVRRTVMEVLLMGRHGLLLDMPEKADVNSVPYIAHYHAEDITNWKRQFWRNKRVLSRVVLQDFPADQDGEDEARFLELYLDFENLTNGEPTYRVRRWHVGVTRSNNGQVQTITPKEDPIESTPTVRGKPLNYIPFYFVGPYTNKPELEKSPVLDLCDTAIAHYQVGADYRHALFMLAQPTPYIVGDLDKGEVPRKIGATAFWVLPSKVQDLGMLEYSGNGVASLLDALDKYEAMMGALGAKLIHRMTQPETAEATMVKAKDEISVVESTVLSTRDAYRALLMDAAEWIGNNRKAAEFDMDRDFVDIAADPGLLSELFKQLQQGGISPAVFHLNYQRMKIVPVHVSREDEEKAIDEWQEKQAAKAAERQAAAGLPPGGDNEDAGDDGDETSDEDAEEVIQAGNPYKIAKRGGEFVVVKIANGKVMGTHDTLAKAQAQFRALEAAAHKEKA